MSKQLLSTRWYTSSGLSMSSGYHTFLTRTRFASGKGSFYVKDTDDDTQEFDVAGFAFAFKVEIGM
jgi:hypothetical protein